MSDRPDCPMCARLRTADVPRLAELEETVAFLGENQGCPGWCVLVLKEHAEHLAELPIASQQRGFADVARVAAAIRSVFPTSGAGGGPPRINYECLGNVVAHVHWHVIPRHADDPSPRAPVWGWDGARLRSDMSEAEREALAARLRGALITAGTCSPRSC